MIRSLMTSAALAGALLLPAAAETYAITGMTVWTGDGSEAMSGATVIIEDGTVSGIGTDIDLPDGAIRLEATGGWVTPGIFAPYTRLGLVEVNAESSTDDTSAPASPYSVSLEASDGFNPDATAIDASRIEGVTHAAVFPGFGSSIFAGQGFVIDTSGSPLSVLQENALLFVNMDKSGADISGGSRAATFAYFDAAIRDARNFADRYEDELHGEVLNRYDALALRKAITGGQPIVIMARRKSDIRSVIELKAGDPQLNIILLGAEEGWMLAQDLADADIPVIADPFSNLPADFSQLGATQRNVARMMKAGVEVAITHADSPAHQPRLTLQSAGNAVANGADHSDALAAITTVPAGFFGLGDTFTLQEGSAANLVVWDGDPLEVMSAPVAVFIDGKRQSMESRQTKLRDRYLDLERGDLPPAYD